MMSDKTKAKHFKEWGTRIKSEINLEITETGMNTLNNNKELQFEFDDCIITLSKRNFKDGERENDTI